MDLSVLDGYSSDDASDNCELPPKINSPRSTMPPEEYISGTADAESNPSGNQLDTGHGTFAPIYSREITPNHLPEMNSPASKTIQRQSSCLLPYFSEEKVNKINMSNLNIAILTTPVDEVVNDDMMRFVNFDAAIDPVF